MPRIARDPTTWRQIRKELGAKIRAARHARGLTLERLAGACGFADYKPMHQIEKGLMGIPPERIAILEDVLGFAPFDLFTLEAACRLECQGFNVQPWLRALAGRPTPVVREEVDRQAAGDGAEVPDQEPEEIPMLPVESL